MFSRFTGLGNFQTAYWRSPIYDGRRALIHVLMSLSDGLSSGTQRASPQGVERPVKTELKVDKSVWMGSEAVLHAMPLLNLQVLRHLHANFSKKIWYTLDDERVLERNVAKALDVKASDFLLVITSLSHEFVQALQTEQPAVKRSMAVELTTKENATGSPETSVEAGLSLEDHKPLLHKAETPPQDSVNSSSVKEKASSSTLKMAGR